MDKTKRLSKIFPYYFDDGQTTFYGTCSINKLKKAYHDNYDYFQVHLLDGTLFIKDVSKTKIYEETFQKIKAVIALKREYLQKEAYTYEKEICFISRNRTIQNQYEVMVVNSDIEQKLTNKEVLNWLLQDLIKKLFIGNEKFLLLIK
ncbi:hypothetical protein PDN14_25475 [Bacillus cereus group sp. Bc222]|uniref:hypothetical protein n=1 Tax=Bacillus cereus group sp. Bc222 TaxID=3018111 RepID=UPI0022E6D118|nr:hypothetical protein [Bacillus cereus group sp. Bc222]MDA2241747.1 hypothetical protein [Bacillus cereus group sp. Bc222]